jgi:tetraacyldisaccharide 4'-kinase
MSRLEAFFLRQWYGATDADAATEAHGAPGSHLANLIAALLLRPLSWIYGGVMALRRAAYARGWLASYRVAKPVVVVGNISVGGTGKTPVVLALVTALNARGIQTGIVTRGYGAKVVDTKVLDTTASVANGSEPLGDEARLLAARTGAPLVASPNRVAGASELLALHPGVQCVVSDDGLQHTRLQRSVEIAVVDAARGFGNGALLPAGPLREPVARLATVDCIVLNNTSIDAAFGAKMPEVAHQLASLSILLASFGKPVFALRYGNERMVRVAKHDAAIERGSEPMLVDVWVRSVQAPPPASSASSMPSTRIAAVAGIGDPARFFAHLRGLGVALASTHAFADHHAFTAADLAAIDADIIVMTEKDAVKCREFADARCVMMQIDALLPDAFFDFVEEKIRHAA